MMFPSSSKIYIEIGAPLVLRGLFFAKEFFAPPPTWALVNLRSFLVLRATRAFYLILTCNWFHQVSLEAMSTSVNVRVAPPPPQRFFLFRSLCQKIGVKVACKWVPRTAQIFRNILGIIYSVDLPRFIKIKRETTSISRRRSKKWVYLHKHIRSIWLTAGRCYWSFSGQAHFTPLLFIIFFPMTTSKKYI